MDMDDKGKAIYLIREMCKIVNHVDPDGLSYIPSLDEVKFDPDDWLNVLHHRLELGWWKEREEYSFACRKQVEFESMYRFAESLLNVSSIGTIQNDKIKELVNMCKTPWVDRWAIVEFAKELDSKVED